MTKERVVKTSELLDLVKRSGKNQKELCKMFGLNESTFSAWKKREYLPSESNKAFDFFDFVKEYVNKKECVVGMEKVEEVVVKPELIHIDSEKFKVSVDKSVITCNGVEFILGKKVFGELNGECDIDKETYDKIVTMCQLNATDFIVKEKPKPKAKNVVSDNGEVLTKLDSLESAIATMFSAMNKGIATKTDVVAVKEDVDDRLENILKKVNAILQIVAKMQEKIIVIEGNTEVILDSLKEVSLDDDERAMLLVKDFISKGKVYEVTILKTANEMGIPREAMMRAREHMNLEAVLSNGNRVWKKKGGANA